MAISQKALPSEFHLDIDPEVFNPVYFPYLEKVAQFECYYGGSASGKSFFIAQKLAIQMTMMPGRNLVALRTQQTDCVKSCYPELYKALDFFHLLDFWKITEHPVPYMVNRINGNEIMFSGVDNIEDIKSITFKHGNMTDAWYEEISSEQDPKVLREIKRRLRDPKIKGRIILSFNPISRTHWLFDYVTNQLPKRDNIILKTTYKDNRWCPADTKADFEFLRYTSPVEYSIYALGDWGTTGVTVFNANLLNNRLTKLRDLHYENPPRRIEFSYERDKNGLPNKDSFRSFDHSDGETWIYKEPEKKVPYVLAFDTAGEGSDYYAGHIINNLTGEQVAVYHSQQNPDICVLQLFGLAWYYNEALVCPEVNFDAYPLKKFQELGYTNFYRKMSPSDSVRERTELKYGFRTTSANRQEMLSALVSWTAEHIALINDVATIEEMMTFTRQERKMKGIFWAAESGAHDDCFVKGTLVLTDKGQIPIEKIKKGDMVLTRNGYKPVVMTRNRRKKVISNIGLVGTPTHPVFTLEGEKPLDLVRDSDIIYMWNNRLSVIEEVQVWNAKQLFITGKNITDTQNPNGDNTAHIFGDTINGKNLHSRCIDKYGLITLVKFPKDMLSIIKMKIHLITQLIILNVLQRVNIALTICLKKKDETNQSKTVKNKAKESKKTLKIGEKIIHKNLKRFILQMVKLKQKELFQLFQNGVKKTREKRDNLLKKMEEKFVQKDGENIKRVYNLQVFDTPEYFANNILVHNCVISLAIALQARSQQFCELQPEKTKLEGEWDKIDLEMAVESGRIDKQTVQEYIRRHENRFKKERIGRSRYAR